MMVVKLARASVMALAIFGVTQAYAVQRRYATDPARYKIFEKPGWTMCMVTHYAPSTSGDPHAGEYVREFWSQPFEWNGPLRLERQDYSPQYMLTGALFEEHAAALAQASGLTARFFDQGKCSFHSNEAQAAAELERGRQRVGGRTFIVAPPPTRAMLERASRAVATETGIAWEDGEKKVPETAGKLSARTAEPSTDRLAPQPGKPDPAAAAIAARAEREAKWEKEQADYRDALAAQQAKVAEFERKERELAEQKAAQKLAADKAAAAHQAELAAHAERVRQQQADYAAQLAAREAMLRKGAGKASTDTDANRCVSAPTLQANATTRGNTAASVVNGCGQPVDVRICLQTDKGWNCGATYGLAPQARWSHSSYNATGSVFSDARPSRSNRPLASPN